MKESDPNIPGEGISSNGKNPHTIKLEKRGEKLSRRLILILIGLLSIVLIMLIYLVNEWLEVKGASEEYLATHFDFGGADQPFYRKSPEAYLRFTLRFIIIYFMISVFGMVSILLRKSWLYLLNILLALIAILYFFLL